MEYQPFNQSRRLFEPTPLDTEGFRLAVNKAADRYWQNRTTADTIETQLNMLDLDKSYEHIRQNQLTAHKKSIESIVSGEGFLNGSSAVADMVKDYTNNTQLQTAVKNTESYNKWKAELRNLVDAGKYDADDYQDMLLRTTLPNLDKPNEVSAYDKFNPDYAPERYDFKALYDSVVAGYKPDSYQETNSSLIKEDSGMKFQDGTPFLLPSAKRVVTNQSNYTPRNEIGTIIDNLISSDPKAMQYLKHKLAIDINKANNYQTPITWRDIDESNPEMQAALVDKLARYKEAAIMEVNNNITSVVNEDIDNSDEYLRGMRSTGNFTPTSFVISGTDALMQSDAVAPGVKAVEDAIGTKLSRGWEKGMATLRGLISGTFLDNSTTAKMLSSEDLSYGLEIGNAILQAYGSSAKTLAELRSPKNKAKIEAHLRQMNAYTSFAKQNVTFLPFAINSSNDPNIAAIKKDLEEDIRADLTSVDNSAAHRYIDLATQKEIEPSKLRVAGKELTIDAGGQYNPYHHLTKTAGESFYEPFVVNINGRKVLVDNHTGVDQTPRGIVTKLTSIMYSNAVHYSGNSLKGVDVPIHIEFQNGIPTVVPKPTDTSIKFSSKLENVKQPDGRIVQAIIYTSYDKNGKPKDSVTFNPSTPKFSNTVYDIDGSPKRLPLDIEFLFNSLQQ